jgi:hypothetical protein
MRGTCARLVFASLLTTAIAAPAAAQSAVSSFADLGRRLEADRTVYVQTAEVRDEHGRGIKGKVVDLSESTLRLAVRGDYLLFSERDVLVVSERHTSAGKGALIGLAVGGGLGLFGVTAACGSSKDAETCAWARFGLMLGAGFGTLLGAEIGHSIEHEQVLFLAPDLRQSRRLTITPSVGKARKALAASIRF